MHVSVENYAASKIVIHSSNTAQVARLFREDWLATHFGSE